MAIIFDLDQTLVDSSSAEQHRTNRSWATVYSLIPGFKYYEGFAKIFEFIKEKKIPTCIVTNSPSTYCTKVAKHHNIVCDFHICYHDTKKRKPDPEPILLAISKFDSEPNKTLSVGDRDIDIIASNKAGAKTVACLWGATDKESLLAANPHYVARTPNDLLEIIKKFYS
ncbi:HAD family hydrolase [Pedobacter changchengzhani]|uniref:phosphoglycolate phosphatase n=1 Tax=Pedobacter changchengzhani TaxID=2529274 RepID=A0A4R5MJH1_9SPHI|nr:HAD family hydrolase [Pedobacter changchengzhani]TDG35774.1 HAD family hydrolase [Pedobacter changchengzhani]